jgi:hypothetical protein
MQQSWTDEFYKELNPEVRFKIWKENAGDTDSTSEKLREKLWVMRYGKRKPKNDAFVGYLMQMKYISESKGLDIGGAMRKQADSVINGLGLFDVDKLSVEEQDIIGAELKNAFLKFIDVSRNGRGFTSIVFGTGQLSDESVARKIAEQISKIAFAAPHSLHMDKEFALMQKAALEAFREVYPNREHFLKK